ncbi:hypothetical protein Q9L58_004038 [Maublancomyces gigas]|uniref:Uncharacterized protein n=1 Tax=Discina gigas TaxID=1032678 RepID=A0ABR3GLY1_9PEZI
MDKLTSHIPFIKTSQGVGDCLAIQEPRIFASLFYHTIPGLPRPTFLHSMSAQDLAPGSQAGTPHNPHIHSLSTEDRNHNSDVDHNSFSSNDKKNHAFRTSETNLAAGGRAADPRTDHSPVSRKEIKRQVDQMGVETAGLGKAPETPGSAAAGGGTPNVPTGRQHLFDGFSPLLHWEQKMAVPDSETTGSEDTLSKVKGH